jgi:hypothetical protein
MDSQTTNALASGLVKGLVYVVVGGVGAWIVGGVVKLITKLFK